MKRPLDSFIAQMAPTPGDDATTADDVHLAEVATSALDVQVAGNHYKDMAIQPVQFIHANKLGFLEGCIVKRICRWRAKDGIKDLEKIKHEVDLLIELERGKQA